jgi:hypothetical protein
VTLTAPTSHWIPPQRGTTRVTVLRVILCATLVSLSVSLLVSATASAAFVRPFLREIPGTCPAPGSCTPEEAVPFGASGPLGLATDGEDHLWAGDRADFTELSPVQLSGFDSGEHENLFVQTREVVSPEPPSHAEHAVPNSLAINRSDGRSYLTGGVTVGSFTNAPLEIFDSTGAFVNSVQGFKAAVAVAVDNSTDALLDPSACGTVPLSGSECFVYLSHNSSGAPNGDAQPLGVEKLDGGGAPVPFSASAAYIEGNEIVGTPPLSAGGCEMIANRFPGDAEFLGAIAVDATGDIFVPYGQCKEGALKTPVVLEYRASGEFVRKITGAETPGIHGQHDFGGFGGAITGIALDPVSDHLIISAAQTDNEGRAVAGAIDEFDASNGFYVTQITETSVGSLLRLPVQMTVDSRGFLYVSEQAGKVVDVFGPGQFPPGLRVTEPSERGRSGVVLNGSVNPEGLALEDCRFQWVTEAAFNENVAVTKDGFSALGSGGEAACVPGAAEVPVDASWHAVRAAAGSLVSGVTYRYRLLASTAGALGGSAASAVFAVTAPHAPRIESVSAGNLSSTFADLHARIDPLGAATSYHFEYDTSPYTAGGSEHGVSVPVPDAAIGSGGPNGSTPAAVLQHIGGLRPGTPYHFRVVVVNEIEGRREVTQSEDAVFSTTPAGLPGLPDGRSYELVTPASKGSAVDMFNAPPGFDGEFESKTFGAPADSGDGFLLEAEAALAPFSASFINAYTFSRARDGWHYTALASPSLGVQSFNALKLGAGPVFDPATLSRISFLDQIGSLASEQGARPTVVAGAPGGPYTLLHADAAINQREEDREETLVVGASHDLSHLVLESRDHTLAPGDAAQGPETRALYEWEGGGECASTASACKLVNVDSKGALLNRCGATLGAAAPDGVGEAHNAVSSDGSKVFFTAPDPAPPQTGGPGCWNGGNVNPPELYMRFAAKTVLVSAPQPGVKEAGHPPVPQPAAFVGASQDGSKVYFLSREVLTTDDEGIHDNELYEYDSVTGALTRVSKGQAGNAQANIFSVKAVSQDGSTVYFEAFGRLTANAPQLLPEGQAYVYRYGPNAEGALETSYVGTVFTFEATQGGELRWFPELGKRLPQAAPVSKSDWYATPDGRFLLFGTSQAQTGYSPVGRCPKPPITQVENKGRCQELYRYDASRPLSEGRVGVPENPVCVSCNPSGVPPVSHARFTRSNFDGASQSAARSLADDGSYAFFDTADALVPQDTNGTLDVYEWEANGRGGCETAGGCVRLISSGADPSPSYFLGASPDGANVFFGTHARLVAQDTDTAGDLYDARICTEADPCIKAQPGRTALCEGDACQSSTPAAPVPAPATLNSSGGGNAAGSPQKGSPPTKAQLLAKALRVCRRRHPRSKKLRSVCERKAERRYGVTPRTRTNKPGRATHGRGK